MTNPVTALGAKILDTVEYAGQLVLLFLDTIFWSLRGKFRYQMFLQQALEIGIRSQTVVIVTGVFTGAVFTAQLFYQFQKVGLESAAGASLSVAMFRELGPVLTALMLTGRVGAGMTAEIGTMKVTEQIDALRSMGVSPVNYLVVPRMMAMLFCMPILVWQSILCGILAGYVVGVEIFGIQAPYYLKWMHDWTDARDVIFALCKSFVFAILIVTISCREGLWARDGAVGVGRATTTAVVNASLAVLIVNFFLTMVLSVFFPSTDG
jgi:phospholipid/cholesterol/gamma-HCH transport system permease protein